MSKRTDRELLSDIREALRRIATYVTGMSYKTFLNDTKTQDAILRNLEILGEATKSVSEEFRTENRAVPWKNMARARDRLIHHYFGVNLDIVWQIVSVELPALGSQLDAIEANKGPNDA
jgi:uncharacterized protein with HEPN domain